MNRLREVAVKKEDWELSKGLNRDVADAIAHENGFADPKRKTIIRKQFEIFMNEAIMDCVIKSLGVDADQFVSRMGDTLGWDYLGSTGWRRKKQKAGQGLSDQKDTAPPSKEILQFLIHDKKSDLVVYDDCTYIAISKLLMFIASQMRYKYKGRNNLIARDDECLRYAFGNKFLLMSHLAPIKEQRDHLMKYIGVYFPSERDVDVLEKLRRLVALWHDPWVIMELSLPGRWIRWGYYPDEQRAK